MEDGHLSDAKGRRVDFRNALIIMTSNIGAKLIQGSKGIGFAITTDEQTLQENEYQQMKNRVMDALKKTFRPEFINRLDGIMVFRSLSKEEITKIVELELRTLRMQLAEQEMELVLTEDARLAIADTGYDPDYGARPLRRVIQNEIQDQLSEALLSNRFTPGDTIQVDYTKTDGTDPKKKGEFVFEAIAHREIQAEDTETTEAIEAMLQQ
jgi:ATP-dependent Clp protease ATP-binding subunit ClpC